MSIMKHKYVENLSLRQQQNPMKWKTAAGEFNNNGYQVDIKFSLPQLHESRMVQWDAHVAKTTGN
jgi:hypothetical protein